MQILRTIHIGNVWVMLWELIATSAIVWAKYKMPCSPLCTSYLWVEFEGRTFTLITFSFTTDVWWRDENWSQCNQQPENWSVVPRDHQELWEDAHTISGSCRNYFMELFSTISFREPSISYGACSTKTKGSGKDRFWKSSNSGLVVLYCISDHQSGRFRQACAVRS